MSLNEELQKKLKKLYQPSTLIHMRFRGKDIAFKTDEKGNPVQLFIGQLKENGNIRGERYARKMVKDQSGKLIKDHWDKKGRSG